MPIGFKVCKYDHDALVSPGAPGFGRTYYRPFGVTYPNPNCGPLTVYIDYLSIPPSWRKKVFPSLRVFRCSYEDSHETGIWASSVGSSACPTYVRFKEHLKPHTVLAKWVRLLEEIDPVPSEYIEGNFRIDAEEFVAPEPLYSKSWPVCF